MIGKIVGNYKIIETLGEGGVGMVYKGVDTMLDREVAIKVLRPELASQDSVVERFRTEAVTLAKLNHPNIATLYSLFRQGDDLFMVLEFIRGETLDQILYRRGLISAEEALPIFCQALDGINYAHRLGIVHRDIKPGNMMLTESNILKVLDFGIARLLGSSRMTRVGNIIGTLEYMSPEQVRGLETDARSDVYGLGIMLYEILTGRLPFESENEFELMKMQTETEPRPPRQLNADIPVEVEDVIMTSVAKEPGERFQTAGEFLEVLLEIGFSLPNTNLGFTTGFHTKLNTRPSKPGLEKNKEPVNSGDIAIPKPDFAPQTENYNDNVTEEMPVKTGEQSGFALEIKGTRIGETDVSPAGKAKIKGTRLAEAAPVTNSAKEIKTTRLGNNTPEEFVEYETNESQPGNVWSFLQRLTWVHYAGAGAVVFLFSLFAGGAILAMVFGSSGQKPLVEPQKIEQNSEGKTEKTPVAVTNSQPEQIAQPIVKEEVPTPIPLTDESTELPLGENPPTEITEKPVRNPPKSREEVKRNPTPSPPGNKKADPPPPRVKPTKKPDTKAREDKLREILTDN